MALTFSMKEIADKHIEKLAEARNGMDVETFETLVGAMCDYLTPGNEYVQDKIHLKEALSASDASILFPRVFDTTLAKPVEAPMIGQTLLSKKVRIEGARSYEFPGIGSMQAFDIADGQAYPEQSLAFNEHRLEVKTGKSGLVVHLSEDVIADSQWELVGLYLTEAKNALNRHKEKKIFSEFVRWGHPVFDNTQNDVTALTNGKASDGTTRNGSVAFDDFVDTLGAIVANTFIPTDIILHPLAWVIFAKNPILRNLMLTQGTMGMNSWTSVGPDSMQVNIPWNIQVQITPFQSYSQQVTKTIYTAANSGVSVTDDFTDITVVDRAQAMLLLVRDEPSVEDFNDPMRDVQSIKVKERYGLGVPNQGRGVAVMKNVRVTQDYSPAYVVGNVTMA